MTFEFVDFGLTNEYRLAATPQERMPSRTGAAQNERMVFAKKLRSRIKRGEITTTIRIWQSPHVKQGGRYRLGRGHVEVTSIEKIRLREITESMAVESGFEGVHDLLETARHGTGKNVYSIRFRYLKAPRQIEDW